MRKSYRLFAALPNRRWFEGVGKAKALTWILFVILIAAATAPGLSVQADQQPGTWTPQHRIPDYGDESRAPFLVAGLDRTVYAFNTQPDGDQTSAIFIRTWSLTHGWSPPVDILLSPLPGAPVVKGAFLDQNNIIHLIFFAGDQQYGNIYYSFAPVSLADRPQAWSAPTIIGENAIDTGAALVGDGKNNLVSLFGGKKDGVGIYATLSTDQGASWSAPSLVTLMQDNTLIPNGLQAIIDPQGRLHAVWSEVNEQGIDQAVYYARLDSDHQTWSQPFILARRDAGDYKAAWPSIIAYKGSLMVIYQDSNPATRWMRTSPDGGQTWTDPVRPWPHVGEYNQADLLIDSSNTLHIILGNRDGECCHGMWHGTWLGDHWGPLEPIVMGPKTSQFDPSDPRSIISQGNVLLATWWTDTGGGPRNGAWYSYTVLNAPELPVLTRTQIPGATSTSPTPTMGPGVSIETSIPETNPDRSLVEKPVSRNPGVPIIAGILPVLGLFLGVILFYSKNHPHS